MISRDAIKALIEAKLIEVKSQFPLRIGPNSIDLHFGDSLKQYHPKEGRTPVFDPVHEGLFLAIDPKNPPPLIDVPKVDKDGYRDCWLLVPGQFYLGVTEEETYCRGVVPHLDGRSTCGRLSIEAHKTAGVGDNGFRGRWTLEIEATEPVLIRPGDRLFQIYFTPAWGAGLAHFIRTAAPSPPQTGEHWVVPPFAKFNEQDPMYVDFGVAPDGQPLTTDPLLEVNDLYGKDGGHHYQGSDQVRGPSPLD